MDSIWRTLLRNDVKALISSGICPPTGSTGNVGSPPLNGLFSRIDGMEVVNKEGRPKNGVVGFIRNVASELRSDGNPWKGYWLRGSILNEDVVSKGLNKSASFGMVTGSVSGMQTEPISETFVITFSSLSALSLNGELQLPDEVSDRGDAYSMTPFERDPFADRDPFRCWSSFLLVSINSHCSHVHSAN